MLVAPLVGVVALSTASGGVVGATAGDPDPKSALLRRLVAAYHEPGVDPTHRAWRDLLSDDGFATVPVDVLEFVKLERTAGAKARYQRFIAALTRALGPRGAEMITVNDTLQVGVGSLPGYADGVSWLARFPSRSAYVDALLDRRVVMSSRQRGAAVAEAQVLVGSNAVPELIQNLPPTPRRRRSRALGSMARRPTRSSTSSSRSIPQGVPIRPGRCSSA